MPLCELSLDGGLLGGTLGDHLRLLLTRILQIGAPRLHLAAELLHLREDARVLARDALDRIEARDHVVEASCAEQHLERRVTLAVHVQVAKALRDAALSHVQALARSNEVPCVALELSVDPVELDVRAVVCLDRSRRGSCRGSRARR